MSIGKPRGVNGHRPVFVYDKERKDKRYVATVGACTGSGNARSCKCAECKRARRIEHDEYATKRPAERALSVDQWAQEWLDELHGEGTERPAPGTLRHNRERISAFTSLHGRRRLTSITADEAEDFARDNPGRISAVKAMFRDAERRRRITSSPFKEVKTPKGEGRESIDPLTEDEVARLAAIARGHHGLYGKEFAALVAFMAWVGTRPGEVCGLEWAEVDLGAKVVYVEWQRRNDGSRARTKTKENRVVPLERQALEALSALPRRGGAVFRSPSGKTLRPNSLRRFWVPVRNVFEAELPMDHWLSRRLRHDPTDHLDPYELRHFFGSLLADQGLTARDISEVLGNSPEVCERVYVHPHLSRVQDRVRAALQGAQGNLSVVEFRERGEGTGA